MSATVFPSTTTRAAVRTSFSVKKSPWVHLPTANLQIVLVGSFDTRLPVLVAENELSLRLRNRRGQRDGGQLLDGLHVAFRQRLALIRRPARTAAVKFPLPP